MACMQSCRTVSHTHGHHQIHYNWHSGNHDRRFRPCVCSSTPTLGALALMSVIFIRPTRHFLNIWPSSTLMKLRRVPARGVLACMLRSANSCMPSLARASPDPPFGPQRSGQAWCKFQHLVNHLHARHVFPAANSGAWDAQCSFASSHWNLWTGIFIKKVKMWKVWGESLPCPP